MDSSFEKFVEVGQPPIEVGQVKEKLSFVNH
jgi:hypothetical protein